MLKDKKQLEKDFEKVSILLTQDNKKAQDIYNICYKKHKLPRGIVSDILTLRIYVGTVNEFYLYCVMEALEEKELLSSNIINRYYSKDEIRIYSSAIYEDDDCIFPMDLAMIQVGNDQWIGSIDTETIKRLQKAQLINYNENMQRTKTRIVRGGEEYFVITKNKPAIKEIKKKMEDGLYIPDELTFNISPDANANFEYDKNKHILRINSLDRFDLIDGYHRYLAWSDIINHDPDFDSSMELRITCFDESKAHRFIYQHDQKTKMRKIDSKSFDSFSPANIIVEKLNSNPRSNIQGMVSRNAGKINYGEFANIIAGITLRGMKKKDLTNSVTILIVKDLMDKFNILTEINTDMLERKYNCVDLCVILTAFKTYEAITNEVVDKIVSTINIINEEIKDDKVIKGLYNPNNIRTATYNYTLKKLKGGK